MSRFRQSYCKKTLLSLLSFMLAFTSVTHLSLTQIEATEANVSEMTDQMPSRNLEGAYWYNGVLGHEWGKTGVSAYKSRIVSDRTLAARSYFIPHASLDTAKSHKKNDSQRYQLLSGDDWKFHLVNAPQSVVTNFHELGFDDSKWENITVPASWQFEGYDFPIYTNDRYPWGSWHDDGGGNYNIEKLNYWNLENGVAPSVYNPVGHYRKEFTVNDSMKNQDLILNFEGVESAFYVYLNGKYVGYSEDSFTMHEFDITDKVQDGKNELAVLVYRWSDGSFFENQDFIRYSGIFRDVALIGRPKTAHLKDFFTNVTLTDDYTNALVEVNVEGTADEVQVDLIDAAGSTVATASAVPGSKASLTVNNAHLWSHEDPYLYDLVMTSKSSSEKEVVVHRLGLRQVEKHEIVDGDQKGKHTYTLNGKPILFKGVNRHEASPENGRAVPEDIMIKDIELMKQNNVNAVRTSHYPNANRFYQLADEYGLMIMDEPNLETHMGGRIIPQDKEEFRYPAKHRMQQMFEQNKNYTSIVAFTLGNEAQYGNYPALGHNYAYSIMSEYFHERDIQKRPLIYERDNRQGLVDVRSNMYSSVENDRKELESSDSRPYLQVEYAHAMGQSLGYYKKYWDLWRQYDHAMGGFIWDWVDQSPLWDLPDTVQLSNDVNDAKATVQGRIQKDGDHEILNGNFVYKDNADIANFHGENQSFTLMFDAKLASLNGEQSFINHGDKQYLFKLKDGALEFSIKTGSNWESLTTDKLDTSLVDRYATFAVSYDKGLAKISIDGNVIAEKTLSNKITEDKGKVLRVGKDADYGRKFFGFTRDVAVFSSALNLSENPNISKAKETAADQMVIRQTFTEDKVTTIPFESNGITYGENKDKFFAYGGDWGLDEYANNNNFTNNGLVSSERIPNSEVQQMKYVQQDIHFSNFNKADNSLKVYNEFRYKNIEDYQFTATLEKDGKVVETVPFEVSVDPGKEEVVILNLQHDYVDDAQYYLLVEASLKNDTSWAKAGHVIASEQFNVHEIIKDEHEIAAKSLPKTQVVEDEAKATIKNNDFSLTLNKETGLIDSYIYKGEEMLSEPMHMNFFRPATENDMARGGWNPARQDWKQAHVNKKSNKVTVSVLDEYETLIKVDSHLRNDAYVTETYRVFGDGRVIVDQILKKPDYNWQNEIPAVGRMIPMKDEYQIMEYFGRGPEDNYSDRYHGYPTRHFTDVIDDQNIGNHTKVNEGGNKTGVHWAAFKNASNNGLMIKSDTMKFEVQGQKYDQYDIDKSEHPYALTRTDKTYYRVNMMGAGVGGQDSWGSVPHNEARLWFNKDYHMSFEMIPFNNGNTETFTNSYKTYVSNNDLIHSVSIDGKKLKNFKEDITSYTNLSGNNLEVTLIDPENYSVQHEVIGTTWNVTILDSDQVAVATYRFEFKASSDLNMKDIVESVDAAAEVKNASSAEGAASLAVDGNPDTMWHTPWDGIKLPTQYTIKLKEAQTLDGLTYLPRQGKDSNGIITSYAIKDGDGNILATGTWKTDRGLKVAKFVDPNARADALDTPYSVTTDTVVLEVLASVSTDGKKYASAAEIGLTTPTLLKQTPQTNELEALIQTYESLVPSDYTDDSFKALTEVITKGKALLDSPNLTQEQLDAVVSEIQAGFNQLVDAEVTPTLDKTHLLETIDNAKQLIETDYTPESWKVLIDSLNKVLKEMDSYTTQAAIDQSTQTLSAHIKSLKPVSVDALQKFKSQLDNAKKKDLKAYTEESILAFQKALSALDQALQNEALSVDNVESYTKQLEASLNLLVVKSVDTSKLEALIKQVQAMDLSIYTENSANALQLLLNNALSQLEKGIVNESVVTELIDQINKGIEQLKVKTDIDRIQSFETLKLAVSKAKTKLAFETSFTSETFTAFSEKLNAAQALLKAYEESPETVSTEAIKTMIDELAESVSNLKLVSKEPEETPDDESTTNGNNDDQSGSGTKEPGTTKPVTDDSDTSITTPSEEENTEDGTTVPEDDIAVEDSSNSNTSKDQLPETGMKSNTQWIWIALSSILLGSVFILFKKRKES